FTGPLRNPIDRLVSVIFRKRTAAELEEADQVAADLQVFFRRAFTVGAESGEQFVERLLCQRPPATRGRGAATTSRAALGVNIVPCFHHQSPPQDSFHSPWMVNAAQ